MNKTILFILTIFQTAHLNAQNLYPKKLDNCVTDKFCLDCGDIKVNVDSNKLNILADNLNNSNNLAGIKGRVMFQILVDANGKGCVLSHTDVSDNIISRNITYLKHAGVNYKIVTINNCGHDMITNEGLNGADWNWPSIYWQWRKQPQEFVNSIFEWIKK
jgi:hypothetical protein